jgi:hypothetical protein
METAKLKIVTDTPPPKVIAAKLEASPREPLNAVVTRGIPRRHGGRLDVDGILARSLPKVGGSLEKAA